MHILKTNIFGNPNVGLFGYANNNFCLLPFGASKKLKNEIFEALRVPCYEISIAGTNLIGVFVTGNRNSILVPQIAFEHEINKLKKLKMNFSIVTSKLTALGNNILCNDAGCIVNSEYNSEEINQIQKALKVHVKRGKIADLNTIGSLASMNNKGCLMGNMIMERERKSIEQHLNTTCTLGTVNFGSNYIRSGIICNDRGFVIGNLTSGPEIANADQALGFITGV
ncbi:translation initiation factor IF-6 [Candidatus Woesearchaeota archaeon]|nr:translation initiation factor IF-6 [Candidatus Woesearchaeota archaeon]